jgi:hypothetical protein
MRPQSAQRSASPALTLRTRQRLPRRRHDLHAQYSPIDAVVACPRPTSGLPKSCPAPVRGPAIHCMGLHRSGIVTGQFRALAAATMVMNLVHCDGKLANEQVQFHRSYQIYRIFAHRAETQTTDDTDNTDKRRKRQPNLIPPCYPCHPWFLFRLPLQRKNEKTPHNRCFRKCTSV